MSYKPGDAYTGEFTTCNATTGAATNADSLPTATAAHNGTDDGTFTLTVANVTTGRYKVTGTIPSGYASGDAVQIAVSATVNSVAGAAIIDSFVLDSKRLSDVTNASNQVAANVVAVNGGGVSSTSTVQVDMTQTVPTSPTAQTVGAALNTSIQNGLTLSGPVSANVTQWNNVSVAGNIPPDVLFLHAGTAQGGTASSITLDTGASATPNVYNNAIVFVYGGTGAGQCAIVSAYNGTSKVATISGTWATNPDSTSIFVLLPFGNASINMGQAVPTSNTAQTVGDALNAARAQGFGKWVFSGNTITLYAADGTTVVRTFTLDSITAPTQRV